MTQELSILAEYSELSSPVGKDEVTIVLNEGVSLPTEQIQLLSDSADALHAAYPGLSLNVVVLTREQMEIAQTAAAAAAAKELSGEVFAFAIRSQDPETTPHFIVMNESAFTDDLTSELREFFTPAATTVPAPKALLTHEFGHLLDLAKRGSMRGSNSLLLDTLAPSSEYGRRCGVHEIFAEAFAEYTLTNGHTADPLAQALALKEGWVTLPNPHSENPHVLV